MPYLITLFGELIAFVTRLFFFLKDAWLIVKYNLLFFARILMKFPGFLGKLGRWVIEAWAIAPALVAESSLSTIAEFVSVAASSACCSFIADALQFPNVVQSIQGLSYFVSPLRIDYGIACILCALIIRFTIRLLSHVGPLKRLALPSPGWPKLPGSS
jgi:hypothetical protein